MACVGWARGWERQGQDIGEFPHFKRWFERVTARPAVQRGIALRVEEAGKVDIAKDKEAWKILFTQGARA
jgi:GST-like protein